MKIESCSVRAKRSDRVVDRARSCSSTEAPRGRRFRVRGRVGPLVLVRSSRRVSRGVVGATMRRASAPATPRLVGRGCDGGIEPRRVRSIWHEPRTRGSRNRNTDTADRRDLRARTPSAHRFGRRPESSRSDQPARWTHSCNERKPSGGTRHRANDQTSFGRKAPLHSTR